MRNEQEFLDIIEYHEQRIKDIDNGLLNQFDKSYRAQLRLQSLRIIKNPHISYNPTTEN